MILDLNDNQGIPLENTAIFGDSGGGGLTLGSVLKMRDWRIGMPAPVVGLSPWTDVTLNRKTYVTLKDDDPILYVEAMKNFSAAYADL